MHKVIFSYIIPNIREGFSPAFKNARNIISLRPAPSLSSQFYSTDVTQERIIPIVQESSKTAFSERAEKSTYSAKEVNKFDALSNSWWDIEGEFIALHSLNKLRINLIREGLVQTGQANSEFVYGPQPLKGLQILDVGCGGGIICEPLARLGADVIGIDASKESLAVAELHTSKDKRISSKINYVHSTIEDHSLTSNNLYDAVVASEVIEHVDSIDLFIATCSSLLKPNGSLFLTTLNRTKRSYLGAILAAEYLLRIVPMGTHDWNKFIKPEELSELLGKNELSVHLLRGMFYVPIRNEWFWVQDKSINYALHALKSGNSTMNAKDQEPLK